MSLFSTEYEKFMEQKIVAVIPAAGVGSRMGAKENKVLLEILGRPILAYTLDAFEACSLVHEIIIVAGEQDIFTYQEIVKKYQYKKIHKIVRGGKTRAESVCIGVNEAQDADYGVVHDAARALIKEDVITKTIYKALETGAAIAAVPAVDTIKVAKDMTIQKTLRRDTLWCAQTPQVFKRTLLQEALQKAGAEITDDASALEMAGVLVALEMGSYENLKITTPLDLVIAETVLTQRIKQL